MNSLHDDLEERVINLVNQHSERVVFRRGTEVIPVFHERYRSGLLEFWDEKEEVPKLVRDESRRKEAFAGLLNIGKNTVPILVKILISERDEYPNVYSYIDDGVLPALRELGDEETSRKLVQPFQQKVRKVADLNAEKYDSAEPYENQVWSIARLWEKYPIPEAIPALKMAIAEKVKHKEHPQNYLFLEYIRSSFFDALSSIATEESIVSELNFAKEDAAWSKCSWSNHWLADNSLNAYKGRVGKILYDIYRSTTDRQIKGLSSNILGTSKIGFWLNGVFHSIK